MSRVVAALIMAAATTAHADPENLVLADLGLHVVGIGYQRTLSPKVALQIDADSYTPWTQEDTFFEVQGAILRIRPVFYAYDAPRGWWISPFVQGGIGTADRGTGAVWAVGATVGYAWLVVEHVHIAIGLGAQYDQARIPGGDSRPHFSELWPTIDGTIGYAF